MLHVAAAAILDPLASPAPHHLAGQGAHHPSRLTNTQALLDAHLAARAWPLVLPARLTLPWSRPFALCGRVKG